MLGFYNPFSNLVPKNKVPHKLHFYFLTFFTQTSLATELDLIPSQLHSEIAAPYTIVQNPRGMCNLPEHRWVLLLPLRSHGGCLYLLIPEANRPQLWTHVKMLRVSSIYWNPTDNFINISGSLPFPCQSLHHCLPLIHSGFINISSKRFSSQWVFNKYR